MKTEAREEKVISEGHLARDPKVLKRGSRVGLGVGGTRLFSFNGKKRCHATNKSKQPKRRNAKEIYSSSYSTQKLKARDTQTAEQSSTVPSYLPHRHPRSGD